MTKEELKKKLALHIIKLREAKGLTQNELAQRCGKDKQSLHKVEKGEFLPSVYYLYELSIELGVSLKEMLDFD